MHRDPLLFQEMFDAAQRISELSSARSADEIRQNPDLRDALLWNYTVLGEASSQISPEKKAQYPQIRWEDPVRLRNRIVHGYWSVDLDVLVATAREDIPGLTATLQAIVEESPTASSD